MQPTGNPIQKIRTFADDVRKVQGATVPETPDTRVPTSGASTQGAILQTGLERDVFDVTAASTGVVEPSFAMAGASLLLAVSTIMPACSNSFLGRLYSTG